jgi:hypothetical protein
MPQRADMARVQIRGHCLCRCKASHEKHQSESCAHSQHAHPMHHRRTRSETERATTEHSMRACATTSSLAALHHATQAIVNSLSVSAQISLPAQLQKTNIAASGRATLKRPCSSSCRGVCCACGDGQRGRGEHAPPQRTRGDMNSDGETMTKRRGETEEPQSSQTRSAETRDDNPPSLHWPGRRQTEQHSRRARKECARKKAVFHKLEVSFASCECFSVATDTEPAHFLSPLRREQANPFHVRVSRAPEPHCSLCVFSLFPRRPNGLLFQNSRKNRLPNMVMIVRSEKVRERALFSDRHALCVLGSRSLCHFLICTSAGTDRWCPSTPQTAKRRPTR